MSMNPYFGTYFFFIDSTFPRQQNTQSEHYLKDSTSGIF
uniref:Uncharacterized protein n=1 Tax=Rhizophora mucronata TaxID=61149 RepID=A0A2P2MSA4_RHIMU